jgi:osmotically-inducible protein OsmY
MLLVQKTKKMFAPAPLLVAGLMMITAAPVPNACAQERQQTNSQEQSRSSQEDQSSPSANWSWSKIRDETTEGWLVSKLFARPGMSNIDVEVDNGIATLSGKVPSEQAKRRAVQVANSTAGVESVRDRLTVDSSLANRREPNISEKDLAKQVAQKIANTIDGAKSGEDWWFEGWRVEGPYDRWSMVVEVTEPGRVMLDGEVPNVDTMKKVVKAAGNVAGVRTVDNDLQIQSNQYLGRSPYYEPYYGPYLYGPYAGYPNGPWGYNLPGHPVTQDRAANR